MTTFSTGGSAVTFTTSGSAVSFAVTPASNAFTTSAVLTPGAHASTHGAGGADPITTLGTVTTTLGTVTTLVANTATINAGTAAGLVHTGQSIFAAGSAAGPSIAFTGDTNTGIYSPGADQVGIATAGTVAFRVNASQQVGINTIPGARLHVVNDDSSISMLFAGTTKGVRIGHTSARTVIDGTDNTGVGSYQPLWVGGSTVSLHTSNTERLLVDSAGLITGTGTSLGAWTAYTPTLGGTGWAIGNGTASGRYVQIGKIVHVRLVITFGTTSTFGAGSLTLSIPSGAQTTDRPTNRAHVIYVDSSTGSQYLGTAGFSADTVFLQRITTVDGLLSDITTSTPFAWASTDIIRCSFTYEIA